VSAAVLFHVAWAQVLARISGREDVVFGTVLFGRMQGGIGSDRVMGLFINTLPVRVRVGEEGAEVSVRRMHEQLTELLRHEHASLALAQRCSGVQAPTPLFSALLNYRHSVARKQGRWEKGEGFWEGIRTLQEEARTNYPSMLSVDDMGQGFQLAVQMQLPIEPMRICEYMHTALGSLIQALETRPKREIGCLDVLPERERRQILEEWNETGAEYPHDKCVHELFEEQVEKAPEAMAVVYEDEQLTYGALNRRANQLAHYLRELGVRPDDRVAICVERSLEMVISVLAILKASGAYVPLDPGYPKARLDYMLEDSGPKVVLTQGRLKNLFHKIGEHVAVIDISEVAKWRGQPETNPDQRAVGLTSEHLAYVIYTSGSTGKSKGIELPHRALTNLLTWHTKEFVPKRKTLQFASLSFDASFHEMFSAWISGGCLFVLDEQLRREVSKLSGFVETNGIEKAILPVTVLQGFADLEFEKGFKSRTTSLREVITTGEQLNVTVGIRRWFSKERSCELMNHYGPSETHVVTAYKFTEEPEKWDRHAPIGRPIANTQVYILDEQGEPVPVGVAGELYIGGAGVARGYLNRPELTAERFVPDPYARKAGARVYKTGDLGRWQADGNIEFLGRNDFQVKIRGFRIELGEIEAALGSHAGVRQGMVMAREDEPGEKRLVAYYVAADESVSVEELRAHLRAKLPEYMVPAGYVRLEAMPLTPNGKVDRKGLPAPEGDAYAVVEYEEPRGEIERKVAEIWAEVLKVERVGRQDNFFELGGHSLLAVRMMSRVRQVVGLEVAIRDLFAHPMLADFARDVEGAAPSLLPAITHTERSERLCLSFAQQRLWFLAQIEGVSEAYHVSFGLHLQGHLDDRALQQALDGIVARHETLRTVFQQVDGEAFQRIAAVESSRFCLIEHDLCGYVDGPGELERLAAEEAGVGFDLEAGPLIRGRLIRLSNEEHVLLITMHHIVSDGWSMGIFVRELSKMYDGFVRGKPTDLPKLEVQYADYAVWQRQWMEGEILQRQADFWKTNLAGVPAVLEIPTDHVRPREQDYSGGLVELELDAGLSAGLKELSRRQGTTLYMTLLAGWAALLSRLSGQQDVVIGTPVANRGRVEIEGLIGFFVNTLALRLDLSGSPTVGELLEQAKKQSLAAQQHQDIPFEQVVEIIHPVRSLSHSPIFQVVFAWQNAPGSRLELSGLEVKPLESTPHRVAKFDLTLSLGEVGERIVGGVEYATALFERGTVERYVGHFRRLLEGMVADETEVVDRLPILAAEERDVVVRQWNATAAEYPHDKCVHELFEEQVEKAPEAVAVVYEDEQLTYGELNRRANQLAHYLRELGVKPDQRVAICVERSLEMIVGLLGILKAGGAYVPLDPSYPEERLSFMLEDSAPAALLTQGDLQGLLKGLREDLPVLDVDAPMWKEQPETNPDRDSVRLKPEHVAYVIYTSGSTGTPKGVMIEHRNTVNFIYWAQLSFAELLERTLFSTSLNFDLAVYECFVPITVGGTVQIVRSLLDLTQAPIDISLINTVPSAMQALVEASGIPRTVRGINVAGEQLKSALVERIFSMSEAQRVCNLYGPSEATTYSTWMTMGRNEVSASHIGRPIANTQVYILDGHGEPVPIGVAGELYIGGAGVARGYLNRPELTAERFLSDVPTIPIHLLGSHLLVQNLRSSSLILRLPMDGLGQVMDLDLVWDSVLE